MAAAAAGLIVVPLAGVPSTATDASPSGASEATTLNTLDNVPAEKSQPSLKAQRSAAPQAAAADYPDELVIEDGVTQPVFGYDDAVRERIWVETDLDTDQDGRLDTVILDIIRPAASENGLDVPVVMDASPYYTTVCRGNEGECKADLDGDGLLDVWPLFYDNYFVPRGYAVVLLDTIGTGNNTTGCPDTGGDADNLSAVAGIDWLNGRRKGYDAEGNEVLADWHNGHTGMIGKSYDGTLANAAAATGVEGLSTIVPITAISSWYRYARNEGIVTRNGYQGSLSNTVTNPERRAHCAEFRAQMNIEADDATGDYNDYWAERDYEKDADNVTASVFVIHGLNDWNVMPSNLAFWDAIAERDVPRKIWLTGTGHVDPFEFRREEWVDTLHRWFDHWLQGIDNGIMDEPMADVERAPDVWETYSSWPVPAARPTNLYFTAGANDGPGTLSTRPGRGSQTFTDTPRQTQNQAMADPQNPGDNRLVFLSEELEAPVHISGSPIVDIKARVNDVDTHFAGVLVDYGTRERFSTAGSGIRTTDVETCWGLSSATDDACYFEAEKTVATNSVEMVTKGIIDGQNLQSISETTPLVPGALNDVGVPLQPEDYVFHEGHQIGVVVLGSLTGNGFLSTGALNEAEITVELTRSSIELPVVGGTGALRRAGL